MDKSIIIAGPTTTGKSEIAEIIARNIRGAIINTDNYYFYANDTFHVGLGLAKDEPPADIPHYLFGVRHIAQPKPSPSEFLQLVEHAVYDAVRRGFVPIIQGCSFTLNHTLIRKHKPPHTYIPLWYDTSDLQERCYARVRQMLADGLLDETQKLIDVGYDTAWIAQEGIIYAPTIAFLKSVKRPRDHELIMHISDGIIAKALEQEKKYCRLRTVQRVYHHNDPMSAARKILQNYQQHKHIAHLH